MAGMTDYSHQSFNDMLTDLDNWLKNLVQVCELLEENEAQLKLDDYYWGNINHDVQQYLRQLLARNRLGNRVNSAQTGNLLENLG
jgi:hypothetical protein